MISASARPTPLVCPACKGWLSERTDSLGCLVCNLDFPCSGGIADFSGGTYYDDFPGPEVLSPENLRGLENEREGARMEDFYLPLLGRIAGGSPAPTEPLRVLDSGCGNGESIDVLCRAGLDAWGHDLSALRKWQWSRRERRDRLVVADGASLPFPDGYFDVVIASGVLEHIGVAEIGGGQYSVRPLPNQEELRRQFLTELVRVLGPDARMYLDFPNGAFPIDFWHGVTPGGARFHPREEGFLPTVQETRVLCAAIDPRLQVSARSPEGRLRFNQVSSHWYGRYFRTPMAAVYRLMSLPGLRFLAATSLNPYLVIEISRPAASLS